MQSNVPKGPRPSPTDLYARVLSFEQLPDHKAYLSQYHRLPAASPKGYSPGWNYPIPPSPGYDQALPSYLGQILQSQTPFGCGGPRRAAPTPPPVREPRPAQPEESSVPVEQSPAEPRTRVHYSALPEPDAESAGPALASRLTGEARRIQAFVTLPVTDLERQGAYFLLQQDASLRYCVDTNRFFRTFSDGQSREVLDMAPVSQILRQELPDRSIRLSQLLSHLPYDRHLFGATPRPGRPPAPTPPPFQPIPVTLVPPPVPVPLPAPSPAAVKPPPPGESAPPTSTQAPATVPVPVQVPVPIPTVTLPPSPAAPQAPFTLTVHRYWDVSAGAYVEVQEVLIQGENPADNQPLENFERQPTFVVARTLPLGKSVRVTVTWSNGQTRLWEQIMSHPNGSEAEIFSPLG